MHTPGPFTEPRAYNLADGTTYGLRVYGRNGKTCVHQWNPTGAQPPLDEAIANARLFHAAPDLLAALEDMTDRFEAALEATHATRTDRSVIKESRSLISRAKE